MVLAVFAALLTLFVIIGGAYLFIRKYRVDPDAPGKNGSSSQAPHQKPGSAAAPESQPKVSDVPCASRAARMASDREVDAVAKPGADSSRKPGHARKKGPIPADILDFRGIRRGASAKASHASGDSRPAGSGVPVEKDARTRFAQEAASAHDETSPAPADGTVERSRFLAMGVISAAVFGTLAAKLWAMQVLKSSEYSSAAERNLYSTSYTPAPRGIIYDADGVALVKNRSVFTVLAEADVAKDYDVIVRLSALLGIPCEVVRQRVLDTKYGPQGRRVVAEDVSQRDLAYISEHPDAFPGVTCETRTSRIYPYGALAAHVLGYVGTVSEEELANQQGGRVLRSGDIVGKQGVEQSYDSVLAGEPGARVVITDADGDVKEVVSQSDPVQGSDVYLSIRASVQQVADKALHDVIAPNGQLGGGYGTAGAIVCMDCTNGEVVAMSSFPTFSPESFIGGISQEAWDAYNTEASQYPLMNRAIAGVYPAASTFKSFVSAAALNYGISDANSTYNCTGTWTGFGEDFPQSCWLLTGHGPMGIESGIAHSCDVVFYEIGKAFFEQSSKLGEECLQDYIETFGFGSPTGIDIRGEAEGRIPTPKWKEEYFKDDPEYAQWVGADMSNMCIGQGYVLVTPLQLCCAYCGIATGTVLKPHLLREVRNSEGDVIQEAKTEELSAPDLPQEDAELIRQGLRDVMVVNQYDVQYFNDLGCLAAGKTGTAEVAGEADYTWFACYAPYDNPKYVAACVTEQGVLTERTGVPMLAQVLKAALEYDSGDLDKKKIDVIDSDYGVVPYLMTSGSRTD